MPISMEHWGKDHWSTLAYIETRIIDYHGGLDVRHMRCNSKLHPQFQHIVEGKEYPTRLKEGTIVHDHDDWSCVEDMEAEGLLISLGTGLSPVYKLTDKGYVIAAALRKHKAEGGNFASFNPLA